MKTAIKIILGIVILLTQQSCKSNKTSFYLIPNRLTESAIAKKYVQLPPTDQNMKSIYMADTLSLSAGTIILKSNNTGNYYILPERLTEDEGFCEDLLVQNTECFLMCRVLGRFDKEINYRSTNSGRYIQHIVFDSKPIDEHVKKALVNDSIHKVDGFQCKWLDPWPDKFIIFFVQGFVYNDIIRDIEIEGDNYKVLEFPNPYGYYQVAVPIWLRDEME